MFRQSFLAVCGLGVCGIGLSAAGAGVISVDFAPSGYQTRMEPGEVAGVVPVSNWNSFTETSLNSAFGTVDGEYKPLMDNSGAVIAGAGINWYAPAAMNTSASDTAGDFRMMRGGLFDTGNNIVIRINLPASWAATGYSFIIYGNTPGEGSTEGQIFGVNLEQAAAAQVGNQRIQDEGIVFNGTYIRSDGVLHWSPEEPYQPEYHSNYYQYDDLTSTTLTLVVFLNVNTGGNSWNAAVNGLQLVQAPEPTSLSLLGIAGGFLLIRRRSKVKTSA